MNDPKKQHQPVTSQGMGPQLIADHVAADRARILLRVALSGVQLPFEVFDSALTRATAVIARYQILDAEAVLARAEQRAAAQVPQATDEPPAANGAKRPNKGKALL